MGGKKEAKKGLLYGTTSFFLATRGDKMRQYFETKCKKRIFLLFRSDSLLKCTNLLNVKCKLIHRLMYSSVLGERQLGVSRPRIVGFHAVGFGDHGDVEHGAMMGKALYDKLT